MNSPLFPIANFIFHRPNRLSVAVRVAEARAVLGEAYAAAMRGGFLVPNYEDGELYVTPDAGKREILRAVYEDESILEPGDEVLVGAYPGVVVEDNEDGTYQVQFGASGGQPGSKDKETSVKRDKMKLTKRPKASNKSNKKAPVFWSYASKSANHTFDWGT